MSKIFLNTVLFDRDEPGSFPFNFKPDLKKTFNINKGSTRIILDEPFKIRDEHENFVFTIEINTESTIKKFKRKIKKKIKKRLNEKNISNDIHFNLWKVTENIISLKIIKGTINNYWSEQPSDNFIHVFVDYYLKPIILSQHLTEEITTIAVNLNGRKITPIISDHLKYFNHVEDKFVTVFKSLPLSAVNIGLVDNKESIIVFVYVSEETPVYLPSEFEGFPVLVKYDVDLDFHHRSFHDNLMPGISIGSPKVDACTLGGLFKNIAEPSKNYMLTVKHGVKEEGSEVFQPGKFDKVSQYNYIGSNHNLYYIDYAFCEVENRGIPEMPNIPLGSDITITEICNINFEIINENNNQDLNDIVNYEYVQKVGRSTFTTEGFIEDRVRRFFPPAIINGEKRLDKERKERFALRVVSINDESNKFGMKGDSGSPVFDMHGRLWGIYITGGHPFYYVVPIEWILNDVKERFNATFTLIAHGQSLLDQSQPEIA
ncbi:hypothetical protein RhiirA4_456153 [Rhizophagus irregularis]|uniref:Uncharacterized protein n=1 Tax=Rhizophagus irregularis TaxID=588596 RepID=A0A2I1G6V0_9GLOM|nr:hypothetical protein RhiirA4_456153 [Rhizophagus irregularis]